MFAGPVRIAAALVLGVATLIVGATPSSAEPGSGSTVFINEIHYDNAGADVGEFVEVAGPAGTDLAGWQLIAYNGNGGASYGTFDLSGVLVDQSGGYGFATVAIAGLQNGSPDGVALVNAGTVVQFLSYEGSFTAADGPAAGLGSTDIGVAEPSDSPVGSSLQLTGTGTTAGEFAWAAAAAETPGAVNTDQVFSGEPPVLEDRMVINEVDYDQAGTDTAEFVELHNAGNGVADLTGWSLNLINGSNEAVYDTVALEGPLDPGGYLVVCGDANVVVECDLTFEVATNAIQNGAPDAMTLTDADGVVVDALSYEGSVSGAVEGSGDGLVDDASITASIGRLPDGADTDQNNVDFVVTCVTPGAANAEIASGCGEVPLVAIHDVQGSGDASPLVGTTVAVEGVVVGDYEGQSPNLRGFYLQEEDADADDDPATSEGLFVFHGNEDTVDLGDLVRVTGTVSEFQDQTQLGFPDEITVISSGNAVTPAELTLPFASTGAAEAYEGMLVTTPQTLYVTEFFQLGRFGQVVVSSGDRLYQPTSIADPGTEAAAVQAANDLNRLIVDDATNDQNPDPILFGRNGEPLSADNTLRGGDTLTGAVGVLTYTWAGNNASGNAYRLRPVGDLSDSGLVPGGVVPNFEAANPRPSGPPAVGGSLQVASFNVLNYFLSIDTADTCGPTRDQDCRGADTTLEFDRQRAKLLTALTKLDADVVGLMELENTPGVSPEADLVAGLNDIEGEGTWAYVDAALEGGGVVGTDTIRVGMLYRPDAVTPLGDPALHEFSADPLGENRSRTAVAQSFVENATGEVFTTVVNHLKSKSGSEIGGGLCTTNPTYADCDQGDGQGFFNATRTAHAAELAEWLATDPTGACDDDVLIIGDLNSYAQEDPITTLAGYGYGNLYDDAEYSYVFDGQWGYLDHALASASIAESVTGADHYHINADEPSVLDYNTEFKSAGQVADLYAPDEFRTSDHDPALVGLALGPTGYSAVATPDDLWPPNHQYEAVTVTGDGSELPMTVEILAVTSSEADSGLGEDDLPDDIVVTGPNTLDLRAERYDLNGRTYTITAKVTDCEQTVITTTTVYVAHDRRPAGRGADR